MVTMDTENRDSKPVEFLFALPIAMLSIVVLDFLTGTIQPPVGFATLSTAYYPSLRDGGLT